MSKSQLLYFISSLLIISVYFNRQYFNHKCITVIESQNSILPYISQQSKNIFTIDKKSWAESQNLTGSNAVEIKFLILNDTCKSVTVPVIKKLGFDNQTLK